MKRINNIRFLKRLLVIILIYEAIYLPFVVIMQALTGYDFTAAYAVGGITASVELILCALIKIEETKQEHTLQKEKQYELGNSDTVDSVRDSACSRHSDSGDMLH